MAIPRKLLVLPLLLCLGIVHADVSGKECQAALTAAIEAGENEYHFPNTAVRFEANERLVAKRAQHMRLIGSANTTLWFHPSGGFKLIECQNVSVEFVTIDYDPLPYRQATILKLQAVETQPVLVLPPAKLAPCATFTRPSPPCTSNDWWAKGVVCYQGCPSDSQTRNLTTGRCLCGDKSGPNKMCLPGLECISGECVSGSIAAQRWIMDQPYPGYISSARSPQLCLNVDDCQRDIIYDGCLHTGGTCAGPTNYSIFEFKLQPRANNSDHSAPFGEQNLVSAFGGCVSATAAGTLALVPCDGHAAAWEYSSDLHQLRSGADGHCLTLPGAPPSPPPGPPPSPQPLMKYTLQLAPRSPLLNATCPPGSHCEHDGINQLFSSDGVAKIGSDFGNPTPAVPSPRAPFVSLGNRTYTTIMPAMLAHNESVAQVSIQ
jgi:hypothetical protein